MIIKQQFNGLYGIITSLLSCDARGAFNLESTFNYIVITEYLNITATDALCLFSFCLENKVSESKKLQ